MSMWADPAGSAGPGLSRRRVVAGWLLATVGAGVLTAVLVPSQGGPSPTFEAMLFLSLVVACALVGGLGPALGAALIGTLLLNYFFITPTHTLQIASLENVATLVLFVVVSVAVSSVVDSAARRRSEALAAREEATTLAMLNRVVLEDELDLDELLELVRRTFDARLVELVPAGDQVALGPQDVAVEGTRGWLLVLRDAEVTEAQRRILSAFATHVGVLRDREELARQTAAARELEAANRTRTALLAAVSHDLRTPLAAIKAAAGTLRLAGPGLDEEDREALVVTVDESADTLTRIVVDLLDMSRLASRSVEPLLAEVPLAEVVSTALADTPEGERVAVAPELPVAVVDPGLVERVIANVARNALQHSDRVEIDGAVSGDMVTLRVVDHGPGVPEQDRIRMFEPFQRLGDAPQGVGVGLGLAVARGLAEAQGGAVRVEDTPGGGLTVLIELRGERDATAAG